MPRAPRVDVGDQIYHVINRANGRQTIFKTAEDYRHFERLLEVAVEEKDMRVLAYVLMPNHWHLVLYPHSDGDLGRFMQWLTLTHTQQYRARTETIGYGQLYQGRYKSFLIQNDNHLLTVLKYVERNPVRAKLARTCEAWRWGSAHRRIQGTPRERKLLASLPVDLPRNYRSWINSPEKIEELKEVRVSASKGRPFGTMGFVERVVERFGLGMTTKERGRPKKGT